MRRWWVGIGLATWLLSSLVVSTGCTGSAASTQPSPRPDRADRAELTSTASSPTTSPPYASMFGPTASANSSDPGDSPLRAAERRQAAGDIEGALQILRDAHQTSALDLPGLLQIVRLNQAVAFRRADARQPSSARTAFLETGNWAKLVFDRFPRLSGADAETIALALYNAACSQAMENNPDEALEFLELALDAGFVNFEDLERDPDLDSLRPLASFQSLHDRLRVLYRAQIDEMIRARAANLPAFTFDLKGRDLEGRPVQLSDFRGRPTVVFFWVSGFPACQDQARALVELRRRCPDQSLAVIGLSYDRFSSNEEREEVLTDIRRVVSNLRVTFPCLVGDEATKRQIPDFTGYPSMLFLDGRGEPRLLLTGFENVITLEAVIEWISEDHSGA